MVMPIISFDVNNNIFAVVMHVYNATGIHRILKYLQFNTNHMLQPLSCNILRQDINMLTCSAFLNVITRLFIIYTMSESNAFDLFNLRCMVSLFSEVLISKII